MAQTSGGNHVDLMNNRERGRRNPQISLKVSDEVMSVVKEAAWRSRQTVSAYVRGALVEYLTSIGLLTAETETDPNDCAPK